LLTVTKGGLREVAPPLPSQPDGANVTKPSRGEVTLGGRREEGGYSQRRGRD